MKNTYSLFSVALVAAAGILLAQDASLPPLVFQQAGAIRLFSSFGAESTNLETLKGSPLSASRVSHSLQVLGDGTRIEHTESSQIYRDSQGRTRTETGPAGSATIVIQDPASGFRATLNEATRTAQKMPAPGLTLQSPAVVSRADVDLKLYDLQQQAYALTATTNGAFISTSNTAGESKPEIEALKPQNINGVMASGRRTTSTIPFGQIGNDRPIRVVNETWYSNELQMVVKSSNTDPRFGETTFDLTNINRTEPDSALFQIPSGYTVHEPAAGGRGRGGRGPVTLPAQN